jgi:Xaa-Pro dipeptidase
MSDAVRRRSFATGPFSVDYEQRIDPERLRATRLARARDALTASELDGILVWKDENVRYLTGLRAQLIQGKSALLNGCVLTTDSIVLLCSGGEADRARETMPWIDRVEIVPIMEAAGLIAGAVETVIAPILQELELDAGAIGLDELAYAQVEALRRALPRIALADGDRVMQQARRVKSEDELALMREASAIAEAVTESAINAVAPGIRECEVVAEAMHTLYRLGAEMAHVATPFVASGERMSPPHRFASDKLIRDGDVVFIDIGAMWNGYYSDLGRTVICGSPNRRQREIYSAVHAALEAATAAMSARNTTEDVAQAVLAEGEARGFGESFLSLFIGHGVGIGSNEPPYVGEALAGADTVELEIGMTLAIEPLIWVPDIPGGGGVRLEDTIAVGEQSGIPLTRTRFDERLLLD